MKKLPFLDRSLRPEKIKEKTKIKTWSRSTTILPFFLSKKFEVYNGQKFISLIITEPMIGHKLGEFARTKKRGKDARTKVNKKRSQ